MVPKTRLFHTSSASWPEAELSLGAGRRLSLGSLLGSGSNANVYAATMTLPYGLSRRVAVKMYRLGSSDDCERMTALVRKAAQNLSHVRHPNVVELLELALFDSHPLLVCELVEGLSLARMCEWFGELGRRMPLDLALFIGVEIADALNAARLAVDAKGRQLNLCHLDLTPKDVLLSRAGEVKKPGTDHTTVPAAGSTRVRASLP